MSNTYSNWLGRKVILQIEAGESLVPIRGLVVTESNNALRFRLDGCWEVDIYKEMIIRVEADEYESFQLRNWEAGRKAPIASRFRSRARPMLRWDRAFDRWCSRLCSWQSLWKVICATGFAGSILFVLALQISGRGPFTQFVRFLGSYVGLLLFAVSLGCGIWVFIESIAAPSHTFRKWSKRLASFLDWFRQPIHL
ncbi:MAG TPA: hypothetical protein VKT53_14055 [Candidatus Acidoferrum sp.]|nr:hypothetical protein [Candidatus Acidoferrum sp.]